MVCLLRMLFGRGIIMWQWSCLETVHFWMHSNTHWLLCKNMGNNHEYYNSIFDQINLYHKCGQLVLCSWDYLYDLFLPDKMENVWRIYLFCQVEVLTCNSHVSVFLNSFSLRMAKNLNERKLELIGFLITWKYDWRFVW